MSEVLLRRVILDELEYEPSVDATDIGVAVDKGTPVRWMNVDLHFVEASLVKVPSFLVVV